MITYIIYYRIFSILICASCLILGVKFENTVKMSSRWHIQMHPKPEDNQLDIIEYRENPDGTIDWTLKGSWWTFLKNNWLTSTKQNQRYYCFHSAHSSSSSKPGAYITHSATHLPNDITGGNLPASPGATKSFISLFPPHISFQL